MKEIIKQKSLELKDEIVEFRRDIHTNPELGHEEVRTAGKIVEALEPLGLDEIRIGVGGHGVVGVLKGSQPGKTVLLRADIDALPMTEKTGLPYCSVVNGKMHACGHDVHTSILLGTAKLLSGMRDEIKGNVLFCFQPAEEASPVGGAQGMIDDGLLDDPKVDAAMALHVWNQEVGKVALRDGAMMAQSDRIFITVNGKASHASQPEKGVDAIVCAAQIVTALQTIVARRTDPFDNLVLTLGTIHGGDRYNVLCDKVVIEGTVRIFSNEIAEKMPEMLRKLVTGIGEGMECTVDFEYVRGYTLTENNHELFNIAKAAFDKQIGEENVIIPKYPSSGGEDFSAYGKYVPTLFYWLGMESEKNVGKTTLHNPTLEVDEDSIPVGIETMSALALEYLNS